MKESTIKNTLKGLFVLFTEAKSESVDIGFMKTTDGGFIFRLWIDQTEFSVEGKTPDETIQKAMDKIFPPV